MLNISNDYDGYYVEYIYGGNINNYICRKINIEIRRFNKLVKKLNGLITYERSGKNNYCCHRFKNKEDCKKFLEELEPYLVMAKLMGE